MQRRRFVKNIAWLTGGLLAGCNKKLYTSSEKDNLLKGFVKSGGKGVSNVVISDGYNVVLSDEKGAFEFLLNPDATSVFISTPSGYNFTEEKNIARHYQQVQDIANKQAVNFDLQKLDKDDNEHQFIIWADPQVKNDRDVQKMMDHSVPDVQKIVAGAGSGALIHGITVGDIVWDEQKHFADYNIAVGKMGIPFFQCLGNHDMDYTNGSDESSDDTFQKNYGPTWYSFNRGKVHYVVLDNVRYLGKDRDYDGFIQQHQLDWLQKDLSFVPKENLVVLCLHIPVHNGVKNNADLYALLKDRKVHIMSGHTHYHRNVINDNIYEHNHGTVCGAWWTGPICEDGTPCGYGVYKVKGTDLSWHYQATGESADYQQKIFVSNFDTSRKQVVVNIWNYDPEWRTEYFADGVNRGALEQFEGFDPGAYASLLGPDLPKPRGFAEPKKTAHLFKAFIPVDTKKVVVKTTDRFGNVYESSLSI
ncbi:MAG TPA: calcineurin-like phosphoesterase family protein [Flavisolibacter sp.]|nr:calcineurin-like phosphoesterase family protein [Flavisolibacter sp.]